MAITLKNTGDCSGYIGQGCRQVPPEMIGGKVLWAHPEGYFLNARGQKVAHTFSPVSQRGWTAAHPSSNGNTGGCYPKMRNYGNRLCHHLMYEAFYGPRVEGMEIDHLNGDKLDYRPSNLELVTPAENRRRARYLRVLRETDHDPRIFTSEQLRSFFAYPFEEFKDVACSLFDSKKKQAV